jgi:hypothetical protein
MTTFLNADTIVGGAIITADASGSLGLQAAGSEDWNVCCYGVLTLDRETSTATINKITKKS